MSQTHHITPSPLPMFSLVCRNEPRTISAGARKILISNYSLCIALIIALVLGESYSETLFYFLSSLKYSDHFLHSLSLSFFSRYRLPLDIFTQSQSLNSISSLITFTLVCLIQISFPFTKP